MATNVVICLLLIWLAYPLCFAKDPYCRTGRTTDGSICFRSSCFEYGGIVCNPGCGDNPGSFGSTCCCGSVRASGKYCDKHDPPCICQFECTAFPTPFPSKRPTPSPSKRPTPSPSIRPTPSPSMRPTPFPSPSPTNSPTASPSISKGMVASAKCKGTLWKQSGFNSNDDIIFCHKFDTNDYGQIFIIAIILLLINLAMFCLRSWSVSQQWRQRLLEMKWKRITNQQNGRDESKDDMKKDNHNFDNNNVSNVAGNNKKSYKNKRQMELDRHCGMPFEVYLLFHALLCVIYLCIKFILIFNIYDDGMDNQYENVNDRYEKAGFKQFVSAENIILAYLIIHNIIINGNVYELTQNINLSVFKRFTKYGMLLCVMMIWIDVFISIVLLCIKWSLFVVFMYVIVVSLLVLILYVIAVLIIFVLIYLVSRCIPPICETQNRFCPFMMDLFVVEIFSYFYLCTILCFVFLFVGGPKESVISVNWNDPHHKAVGILFIMATCIGLLSVLAGTVYRRRFENGREAEEDQERLNGNPHRQSYGSFESKDNDENGIDEEKEMEEPNYKSIESRNDMKVNDDVPDVVIGDAENNDNINNYDEHDVDIDDDYIKKYDEHNINNDNKKNKNEPDVDIDDDHINKYDEYNINNDNKKNENEPNVDIDDDHINNDDKHNINNDNKKNKNELDVDIDDDHIKKYDEHNINNDNKKNKNVWPQDNENNPTDD